MYIAHEAVCIRITRLVRLLTRPSLSLHGRLPPVLPAAIAVCLQLLSGKCSLLPDMLSGIALITRCAEKLFYIPTCDSRVCVSVSILLGENVHAQSFISSPVRSFSATCFEQIFKAAALQLQVTSVLLLTARDEARG